MIADDALLLDHAAGALPEPLDVLVDAHVELNPDARARLRTLQHGLGQGLDDTAPVALTDGALDRMLQHLDAPTPAAEPIAPPADPTLPRALWPYLQGVAWQPVLPGLIQQLPLPLWWDDTQLSVVRMRPGFRVPNHGHHGAEFNLVLSGGFTDMGEDLRAGHLATRGPEHVHDVLVHDDGPCTVLVVRQGPLIPHTTTGKLVAWLTGF